MHLLTLEDFVQQLKKQDSDKDHDQAIRYSTEFWLEKIDYKHNNLGYLDAIGQRIGLTSLSGKLYIHMDVLLNQEQESQLDKAFAFKTPVIAEFLVESHKNAKTQIHLVQICAKENGPQKVAAPAQTESENTSYDRQRYDDMLLGLLRDKS